MKKNFLITAILASSSLTTAFAADVSADAQVDINKINQIIESAKNEVLPEYPAIKSAKFVVDPNTYSPEKLTFDAKLDVTAVKSVWADAQTTVKVGVGTGLKQVDDINLLEGKLDLGLQTQTLTLVKYLANKALEGGSSAGAGMSPAEKLVRTYIDDIKNAKSIKEVIQKTLVLRDEVVKSNDTELDSLKKMFASTELVETQDGLKVLVKSDSDDDFFGLKFSVSFLVNENDVSANLRVVDVKNKITSQYDDWMKSINQTLALIQTDTAEIHAEVVSGVRAVFEYAASLVKLKDQ